MAPESPQLNRHICKCCNSCTKASVCYVIGSVLCLCLGVTITSQGLRMSLSNEQTSSFGSSPSIFDRMGHMWLLGPVLMVCGLMAAIKATLVMRRRSIQKEMEKLRLSCNNERCQAEWKDEEENVKGALPIEPLVLFL